MDANWHAKPKERDVAVACKRKRERCRVSWAREFYGDDHDDGVSCRWPADAPFLHLSSTGSSIMLSYARI